MSSDYILRVGVLREKPSISHLDKIDNAMFYMAKQYNIEMFLFALEDVDVDSKKINAIFLDKTKSVRRITDFPDVIDMKTWTLKNAKKEKYANALKKLNENCLPVRHYFNAGKSHVYDIMLKNGTYNNLLIPTYIINEFGDLCRSLNEYDNHIIVKPKVGIEGAGIHEIHKSQNDYHVSTDKKTTVYTLQALEELYNDKLYGGRYVVQPYIHSKTSDGCPFDVRIHARRGGDGKYKIFYYPRIGDKNGIVSNIASGGYTMDVKTFMSREFGKQSKFVMSELEKIGKSFPDWFQRFYDKEIIAMGLDIGICRNNDNITLYLFEVNLLYPFAKYFALRVAKLTLEYYWFVYNRSLCSLALKK